uniref:Laminin N-terminal domain-containing protein n=1 Tax=Anopheles culicifacies TaxID=139723 RepID=A0A182LTH7_9DIPT
MLADLRLRPENLLARADLDGFFWVAVGKKDSEARERSNRVDGKELVLPSPVGSVSSIWSWCDNPLRMGGITSLTPIALLVVLTLGVVRSELTPPYFNLAEGRKISATATCGVDTDGPELYCKLVGANTENDHQNQYSVIQGQVCDVCDPSDPDKRHPPEYAIDGTQNWWQSPPLSRGMKYNEVNLTIDFGQVSNDAGCVPHLVEMI